MVFNAKGKRVKILGWGRTTEKPVSGAKPQCDLLEAYLRADSGHRCPSNSETRICFHHGEEKEAINCKGDSGVRYCNVTCYRYCIDVDKANQRILKNIDINKILYRYKNLYIEHPLMINQGDYGVLIGVLSFSQPPDCSPTDLKCLMNFNCETAEVAIYTRVSPYIPWIKETTGEGNISTFLSETKCLS